MLLPVCSYKSAFSWKCSTILVVLPKVKKIGIYIKTLKCNFIYRCIQLLPGWYSKNIILNARLKYKYIPNNLALPMSNDALYIYIYIYIYIE